MTIDITEDDDLSDAAIEMRAFSQMVVHMPAAWTAASIGFKVSNDENGTFLPLYDDDGNLVQIDSPSASQAYVAPAALAAAHWVKLWSQNGSGTNTAQAADRTFTVDLKA
jgi:hypothetical protein